MKSLKIYFAGLMMLILLASCNLRTSPSNNPPTPTASVVEPTLTIEPSFTPAPQPTRRATYELFPTITIGPSVTPMFTPIPAAILLTIQAQVTEGVVGGAARKPFQCKILLNNYPEAGAIFHPKEDFHAIWHVVNTGTSAWTTNNVAFFYRWGTKFQNSTYRENFIPYVVNVKDQLNLQVPMHTPLEPGLYSAVWGLRDKSKKEFFCNLSVMIQVVPKKK